ncbi:hypothetical protein [Brachybacterium subflavum]|uniref:hypothetical protein n=1 Tax=Brachybacterium subflavum TaxID=2585206 RepID=UPI00126674B2|nr:hypothetical protein [Brachybacterium subflavum]
MSTNELRAAAAAMLEEVGRREAEQSARAAVDDAVQAYADSQGITPLQAWRALAPGGVNIPDDPEPEPTPDAPEFVQPSGAHDTYQAGDLVSFQGRIYRSRIANNAYSPIAYPQGWEAIACVRTPGR